MMVQVEGPATYAFSVLRTVDAAHVGRVPDDVDLVDAGPFMHTGLSPLHPASPHSQNRGNRGNRGTAADSSRIPAVFGPLRRPGNRNKSHNRGTRPGQSASEWQPVTGGLSDSQDQSRPLAAIGIVLDAPPRQVQQPVRQFFTGPTFLFLRLLPLPPSRDEAGGRARQFVPIPVRLPSAGVRGRNVLRPGVRQVDVADRVS